MGPSLNNKSGHLPIVFVGASGTAQTKYIAVTGIIRLKYTPGMELTLADQ